MSGEGGTVGVIMRGSENPGSLSIEDLFRRSRAAPDPARVEELVRRCEPLTRRFAFTQ